MAEAVCAKLYQFFLSYSRRDALESGKKENIWFVKFRDDLIRDVAREAKLPTSVPPEDVGFYDRDAIKTGDHWSETLAAALQCSNVMVCLYSPNYFTSEYCGKEFEVFSGRVAALEKKAGARQTGHIIPVHWDLPTKLPKPLPKAVGDLQFEDSDLGADYAERGVMRLLRMNEDSAYQKFLIEISSRIAAAAQTAPPRVTSQPLEQIQNAFQLSATQVPSPGLPPSRGVKAAWLVYVAGTEADYLNIRTARTSYGMQGSEWQPYLPDAEGLIGAVATNVVSSKNLVPAPLAVTAQLVDHLYAAEDSNTMAVIIVDPWSIHIKSFEDAMNALDRARLTNCGVIVLWNTKDPETQMRASLLKSRIQQTFSRIWTSKDVYFQHTVASEPQLKDALGLAIDDIRRRISDRGKLLRGESSPEEFPQLQATATAAQVVP
jgi:FxsC-like protein